MRSLRSKRKNKESIADDNKFQTIVSLVQNLNEKELKALIEGIELTWQAVNKVSQAKIFVNGKLDEIDSAEMLLEE